MKLFKNGEARYDQETDIVKLLQTVRLSKMLFDVSLQKRQRLLIQLNRRQVVESTTEPSDGEEGDIGRLLADLNSKDPLARVFAIGTVNRSLKKFCK